MSTSGRLSDLSTFSAAMGGGTSGYYLSRGNIPPQMSALQNMNYERQHSKGTGSWCGEGSYQLSAFPTCMLGENAYTPAAPSFASAIGFESREPRNNLNSSLYPMASCCGSEATTVRPSGSVSLSRCHLSRKENVFVNANHLDLMVGTGEGGFTDERSEQGSSNGGEPNVVPSRVMSFIDVIPVAIESQSELCRGGVGQPGCRSLPSAYSQDGSLVLGEGRLGDTALSNMPSRQGSMLSQSSLCRLSIPTPRDHYASMHDLHLPPGTDVNLGSFALTSDRCDPKDSSRYASFVLPSSAMDRNVFACDNSMKQPLGSNFFSNSPTNGSFYSPS